MPTINHIELSSAHACGRAASLYILRRFFSKADIVETRHSKIAVRAAHQRVQLQGIHVPIYVKPVDILGRTMKKGEPVAPLFCCLLT
jgi:hypothetical protein